MKPIKCDNCKMFFDGDKYENCPHCKAAASEDNDAVVEKAVSQKKTTGRPSEKKTTEKKATEKKATEKKVTEKKVTEKKATEKKTTEKKQAESKASEPAHKKESSLKRLFKKKTKEEIEEEVVSEEVVPAAAPKKSGKASSKAAYKDDDDEEDEYTESEEGYILPDDEETQPRYAIDDDDEDDEVDEDEVDDDDDDDDYDGETVAPNAVPSIKDALKNADSTSNSADEKTVAFYNFSNAVEPVVGWIICVEGEYMGESFNLKSGRNNIGRSLAMDIALAKEKSVSRERHAAITFEPNHKKFYIQGGESSGLTYVNDELIMMFTELKDYDIITLGQSKFVFLRLCNDKFSWDNYT